MSSRAAPRRSATRIATFVVGVIAAAALALPTAASAHYPYDLVPGWFGESLGPAATANPDCALVESMSQNEFGETRWELYSPGQSEGDWPECKQVWGAGGEQVRCDIYLAYFHHSGGGESPAGSGYCYVLHFAPQEDGTTALASRCSIGVDVFDPAPESWTPYDCRAESLPGWPNSPYGEPLPAEPSKTATCTRRKCTYELSCSNPTGTGNCDAFGLIIKAGASFGVITTTPSAIAANQRGAVQMQTTIFGRQLIKRALKNKKKKINGHAELYATQADAESGSDELDGQRVKIKVKGGR